MALYAALASLAGGLFLWALVPTWHFILHAPSDFWATAVLALVADVSLFGADRQIGGTRRTTLSVCCTFAIFVVWGPAPAIVVQGLAATTSALGHKLGPLRGMFLVSRLILALAAAELTVILLDVGPIQRPDTGLSGHDMVAFIPPTATWLAVSFGLVLLVRVLGAETIPTAVASIRDDLLGTSAAILLVSPLLTTISGWWIVVLALPLLALNQVLRDQMNAQERLRREPVTGLLNRSGLSHRLALFTADDTSRHAELRSFAVIFVNAETALAASHRLGRSVYETIIATAAERLRRAFGANRVGRLPGEGFVIILPDLTGPAARDQANRAIEILDPPVYVQGIPFGLDPSAGVAISPRHGRDLATLIGNAELALADARSRGERSTLYAREVSDIAQHRFEILADLSTELNQATTETGLTVLYQPQVDLRTGLLVGIEALVRWSHPTWGPVPTEELITTIESSQIMQVLTRHVVREVTTQLAAWNAAGTSVRASVNVSVNDLRDDGLVDVLRSALADAKIQPDQLTVEITESALITDMPRVSRTATAIADLGIGLSLDDFGTGYASLQQLSRLPLSEVKIDSVYVADVATNRASRAIVQSVHELGQALGLAVVAEGIEDDATAATLSRLPGMIGQGWLFGRPMPPAEIDRRLRDGELRGGTPLVKTSRHGESAPS